ncbi:MAG: hypothetical protein RLZ98_2072 [Pseudomonadota bacterium]|jgi:peptidoglycan hydrolase-like protein with peptidoglycan-binding domain
MIEARQTLCLALFAALALAVLGNVLLFQPRAAVDGQVVATSGASLQTAAPGRVPLSKPRATPASADVAHELARLGYLSSHDAAAEPLVLAAAVVHYQLDAGLPATGTPDDVLLARLILQHRRPAPRPAGTAVIPPASAASEVVRAIQSSLARRGYTVSRVDGTLSWETVRAITEYEMDRGLASTGRVTADLILRLHDTPGRG